LIDPLRLVERLAVPFERIRSAPRQNPQEEGMANPYAPPQSSVADVAPAGGAITEDILAAMRGTKPWVLLIGILLFLSAAFLVLGAFAMFAGSAVMGVGTGAPRGVMFGMSAFYLVGTVIYILLGVYLVKYSSAIARLLAGGHTADLEDALDQQRKFWKLAGILAVIAIVLMVIGMVAAIAIPAFMMR
jgi:Na+/melibiose symporter-like transporter